MKPKGAPALLVSVRNEAEARAALAGGARVIDAKEPAHGALGAVPQALLEAIADAVPLDVPFSVALGSAETAEAARAAVGTLAALGRPAYAKLAVLGLAGRRHVAHVLGAAVDAAAALAGRVELVAAGFADAGRSRAPTPARLLHAAADARAAGVLLDTAEKDGLGLLAWQSPAALAQFVGDARERGLLVGLAGALRLEELAAVVAFAPDVIGVRGAACEGGRAGEISAARVAMLVERVARAAAVGASPGAAAGAMPTGVSALVPPA